VKCTTGDLRIKRVLYSRKGEDLFLRQQKSLVFFVYSCSREEEQQLKAPWETLEYRGYYTAKKKGGGAGNSDDSKNHGLLKLYWFQE
jgi:hypothetical protein